MPAHKALPYRVVFEIDDALKIWLAAGVMLGAGAFILIIRLRRLRISQAVKLGEER